MRRQCNPYLRPPAGVCDCCGARCFVLIEAGIRCYKCHRGFFLHGRFWRFSPCAFCVVKPDLDCIVCKGTRVMATPRDDVDLGDLAEELRGYEERERAHRTPRAARAAAAVPDAIDIAPTGMAPPTFAP